MNPKGKSLAIVVDGKVNATDIASMFADKYKALYQSVPTSQRDLVLLTTHFMYLSVVYLLPAIQQYYKLA